MPRLAVDSDARFAELAFLDVLDVTPEGRLRLNPGFRDACRQAFESDADCLDNVFQDHILARAIAYGYAGCTDVDELALAALEVAAAEAEESATRV